MATPHCAKLIGASAGVSALIAAQVAILIMRGNEIKDFIERQMDCDNYPTWRDLCEWWAMLVALVSPLAIVFVLAMDSYGIYCCHSTVSIASHIGGTLAGLIMGLAGELCYKAKSGQWLCRRF